MQRAIMITVCTLLRTESLFWKTQPVMNIRQFSPKEGPIKELPKEEGSEPLELPKGYTWDTFDPKDDA